MTDWLSTGPDRADEGETIRAGVSLIMPGGRKTGQWLLEKAGKDDELAKELRRQGGKVLSLILDEETDSGSGHPAGEL